MAFKIYTRTGDKGKTALIGGTKVPKSNIRIESYGTVDELNSFIGLLNDHLADAFAASQPPPPVSGTHEDSPSAPDADLSSSPPTDSTSDFFVSSPVLPTENTVPGIPAVPGISSELTVSALLREIQDRLFTIGASLACDPDKESRMKIPDLKEEDIDLLEKEIDRMNQVLPEMKSFILPGGHVAVSTAHVARCVCRRAERICVQMQEEELYIEPVVLKYLNRLSDYLFVLARWVGHVMNAPEIPWKPRITNGS